MNRTIWEKFDPEIYIHDNYTFIHQEDKRIIDILRRFIEKTEKINKVLEIGTGPNLYPAMLVLPISSRIECLERSNINIDYLNRNIHSLDNNWKTFWKYIQNKSIIYKNRQLQKELFQKVHITHGNIFNFDKGNYDMVLMFFVAESISNSYTVFEKACRKFARTAKIGGTLIAAFMENSSGYKIGNQDFPATSINESHIQKIFNPLTKNLKIYHIPLSLKPLRHGYSGMLLLTAVRKN